MYVEGVSEPKPTNTKWVVPVLAILLIASIIFQLWLFLRIVELEFAVTALEEQVTALEIEKSKVSAKILKIENDLSFVGSLARNADNYAHSHGYSDIRLKTNIRGLESVLPQILQMQATRFDWNQDGLEISGDENREQLGLIAQDVEMIFPELVHEVNGYKTVDYEKITVLLIQAIQEQQELIVNMEERLSNFEKIK